jgi:hypothetical protein
MTEAERQRMLDWLLNERARIEGQIAEIDQRIDHLRGLRHPATSTSPTRTPDTTTAYRVK